KLIDTVRNDLDDLARHAEPAHRFIRDTVRNRGNAFGAFQAFTDKQIERRDGLEEMAARHGQRREVVKRDDRWNPERKWNRPVRSPQNVGVSDARQYELLPQDSIRRAVDSKPAAFDALLIRDFRMSRDQWRYAE